MNQVQDFPPREPRRRVPLIVDDGGEHNVGEATAGDSSPDIEDKFQAWLCVLGAFMFVVPSYGFMQSIGTVQSYLQLNQLQEYSAGNVGWISGMYLFLSYFFNILIGPICDYNGPMVVAPIGMAITVASFLLAAECKTYWHFMLTLGVLGALGGAAMGTIAMSVVAKLFHRRRGSAMGLSLTGSAIGSIIFPIMLRSTLPMLGWQWSMRILAFTIAGITASGLFCFMPYRRLTVNLPTPHLSAQSETVLDFSAFRSPTFAFVSAGSFLLEFAIFGISGLLPTVAIHVGFAPEDAYILITVLGAGSFLGRALPGLISDVIGPFNVLFMTNSFAIIAMVSLFIPLAEKSRIALWVFAALWGFGSGSFLSIPPVCMGKTCAAKDYGRYYGTMTFLVSFAVLLTIPLGAILLDSIGARALAGLMTGSVFLGGVCFTAARALLTGKWLSPATII
ncbi:riboflavin transporter MCH5 [Thozetella sp. PMI_491]|nr:riboflavin transporter MCH5 [Thozetella sp. PMI_491]